MLDSTHPLAELLRRDKRYHRDAYFFVFDALKYAQTRFGMDGPADTDEEIEEEHHVSGQQLCMAIRSYAIKQYGCLAKSVFNHWGVRSTSDFGEIVFNLIDAGQMRKTDSDRREDFDDVFDFDEALSDAFGSVAFDSQEGR